MAGDVVSASTGAMNSLLGKLDTLMGEEYVKLKDVRKEIASLEDEFTSMKALLDKLSDMDELDPQAKEWKNQIKDMSYDIEDCIDDFIHHIGKNHGNTGFVNKAARQLKKLRARHQIASKIQEIKVRVKEAGERRTRYKLDEYTPNPSYVPVDPRVVAIHTEAASLVGMDIPREELVEMVTGEEQVLKVVSVVGFGGLGKTTLANQVYRKLEGQFECKAFVSVSQKPDMPRLLNKILLEVGGNVSHTTAELDDLENIKKHLRDKRYFVVIDDLWDSSAWKIIKCAFPENNRGSRILTTTRMSEVALACCSYSRKYVYHMRPLGEDNSKGLFFSRIFGSSQACPDFAFEDSSADILKKCGGLPLAIISIASLLAGQSSSKWEYVRNSLGSMFEGNPNLEDMMRILDLSYRNLPRHLKTCLLYIGLYPEDHIIKKDDLVRQWIAEGFVSKVRGLHAEDVAGSYFNELINTSMIQPVKTDYNDEVLSCRVHDIMLDLIRLKSEEENFIHVIDDSESSSLHKKPHRVSLHHLIAASGQIPAMVVNGPVRQVRSFVAFTEVCIMPSLEGFKYVRVLQLKFRPSRTFGNSEKVKLAGIGRLFLLKYLKIESRNVELELPNQIRDLRCLETMDIRLARSIVMPKVTIPSDICRLHRLSHLIVVPRGTFEGGIGSLRSLRTLKRFDIRSSSLDSVKSLGELTNLRDLKLCCDSYLEEDNNNNMMVLDALKTTLERLAHSSSCLRSLSVSLSARLSPARSDWFNTLSPFPRNLRRLHVVHTLPRIPRWIAQLHDLYSLELRVEEVVEMSSTEEDDDDDIGILAGLPSLAHLQLQIESVCPRERIAIPNNTGMAFPALKHLTLTGPKPFLAFKSGALPRLQELELVLTEVEWKDFGEWLDPVGMEHLPPGLKKTLIRCFDPEFDGCPLFPGEATQSALRSRFSAHHPGVDLSFYRS